MRRGRTVEAGKGCAYVNQEKGGDKPRTPDRKTPRGASGSNHKTSRHSAGYGRG